MDSDGCQAKAVDVDVVVVGAGPVGLTLANILGLQGVSTLVVEERDTLIDYPRGVGLDDEALRTFQSIGLVDRVRRGAGQDRDGPVEHGGGVQIGDFVKWTAAPASPLNATQRLAARPRGDKENSFGMVGISARVQFGVMPRPRKPMPSGSAISFPCARCAISSEQV